ncbi:SDR family oxidoreductase [uncultured Cohaesibacter sp.]|uniref:SDR family NAD(P)-dependent oxidoreductase n=1 Tax=uncultured Cohaesibacter sp. TaxID=1002546 RepID=UPI0029C6D580|nr:SDR family oxidoreductase [uncultured Cohaesibacter sp.]
MTTTPKTLITGASSGIGAVYADRLAKRGHDLVLVARDKARLDEIAAKLHAETAVSIEVIAADLTNEADLVAVEAKLREDAAISTLVNNAGASGAGNFALADPNEISRLISLNVTAVTRLANAVAGRFAKQGNGTIINIASVVGLAPELHMAVYGATKAFVLFLSQGLQAELGPRGVRVQAVLPAATQTDIWRRSGADMNNLPPMMKVDDLVDAALSGLDQGELITIPPLSDTSMWDAYQAARQAMLPDFAGTKPAPRYTV